MSDSAFLLLEAGIEARNHSVVNVTDIFIVARNRLMYTYMWITQHTYHEQSPGGSRYTAVAAVKNDVK